MKKNYYYLSLILLVFLSVNAVRAQVDVTDRLLVNAGFDEGITFGKDAEAVNYIVNGDHIKDPDNTIGGFADIQGWKLRNTMDWSCSAIFEYGYLGTINGNDVEGRGVIPSAGYNNSTGGCLGLSVAWTNTLEYFQDDLFLPSGKYTLEYATYNASANTSNNTSRVGFVPSTGDAFYSPKNTFASNQWELEKFEFELTTPSAGDIQVGITCSNSGSGGTGRIFFDYVKLIYDIDKDKQNVEIAAAEAFLGEDDNAQLAGAEELQKAINTLKASINDPLSIDLFDKLAEFGKSYSTLKYSKELYDLLVYTEELISNYNPNLYPRSAFLVLQDQNYMPISNKYDNGEVALAEYPVFVKQLKNAIDMYLVSALGLKLHYDFKDVANNIVPDLSGSEYSGTIHGSASILTMGKYDVLRLGNDETGYVDMGKGIGNVVASMDNYTISTFFRVDEGEALEGTGNFLWQFSNKEVNTSTSGEYFFLRMPEPRVAMSNTGWNTEHGFNPGEAYTTLKAEWQHIVIRQNGSDAEIWVNGNLVNSVTDSLRIPSANFSEPTITNWIGRPAFSGDKYLKNTLVYDFRIYNQAVEVNQIAEWAALIPDLNNEFNNAAGDFTEMKKLVDSYKEILARVVVGEKAGEYPQEAKDAFQVEVSEAEEFVGIGKGVQFVIDAKIAELKTAYQTFVNTVNVATYFGDNYLAGWDADQEDGVSPNLAGWIASMEDLTWGPKQAGTAEEATYRTDAIDKFAFYAISSKNSEIITYAYPVNLEAGKNYFFTGANWRRNGQSANDASNVTLAISSTPDANGTILATQTVYCAKAGYDNYSFGFTAPTSGQYYLIRYGEKTTTGMQDGTADLLLTDAYKVTLNLKGGSGVDALFTRSSQITEPENPTKGNAQFEGWFTDEACTSAWNFAAGVVTEDMTLYAKWSGDVNLENVQPKEDIKVFGGQFEIVVLGAGLGEKVFVYDISGRLLQTVEVNNDRTQIAFRPGLYIVKIGTQTNKVIVR